MMNTNIKYIASVFCAAGVLVSCGDLSLNESSYHTKLYQFSDFSKVKEVMTNVYGYVETGFYDFQECATDDAVYAPSPDAVKTYYDGSWSANNLIGDKWEHYYQGIRAANYLIENCPEDFENAKWDENYKYYLEQLKNFPWEAKVLRAYFHFELLKRYNRIVIADRTFKEDEVGSLVPSPYTETADWIASELETAAQNLPNTYSNTYYSELGRVTKGFALALRSRVLLYKASPLNNPSGTKQLYFNAAAAAKDFIDDNTKNKKFSLVQTSFHKESQDVIFCYRESASNLFEKNNFPIGYEGGNSGMCPTMNLVEAFDMIDGTPFDYADDKGALNDPTQRDPRFAKSILSNGDEFKSQIVETFYGGANALPKENATPTSFYLRKFVQEQTSLTTGSASNMVHFYPIIRVQEVYLNYAEALFEATGQADYTGTQSGVTYTMSPREAVNAVRKVYEMPELPAGLSADQFRTRLRNERRVELCFEGQRFWDLRRWKVGSLTENIYGLDITKSADGTYVIEKKTVQQRKWDDKMNFFPISNTEIFKNQNLIQNDGWE